MYIVYIRAHPLCTTFYNMPSSLQCHTEHFHCSKSLLSFTYSSLPTPCPWKLLIVLLSPQFWLLWELVWIMYCIAFSYWLLSFSNIHLNFLCVFLWLDSAFLFVLHNTVSYGCVRVCVHPLWFWQFVNEVLINIHLQVLYGYKVFNSLDSTPRNTSAGSYGKSVFSLVRNCQTLFQSSCTILHSEQQ